LFAKKFEQYASASTMSLEQQRINEACKISAALISILPLFVLYLVVQRKLISGIESAGITGE